MEVFFRCGCFAVFVLRLSFKSNQVNMRPSLIVANLVLLCLIGMSGLSLETGSERKEEESLTNELHQRNNDFLDRMLEEEVRAELHRHNVPREESDFGRARQTSSMTSVPASLPDQPSSSAQAPFANEAILPEVFRPLAIDPADSEPVNAMATLDDLLTASESDQFTALLAVASACAEGITVEKAAPNAIESLDLSGSQTSILDPVVPVIYKKRFEDPCIQVLSTYGNRRVVMEYLSGLLTVSGYPTFYLASLNLHRLASICKQLTSPEMKDRIIEEIRRINRPEKEASSSSTVADTARHPGPTQSPSPAATAIEPEAEQQLASLIVRIRRRQFGGPQSVAYYIRNGFNCIASSAFEVLVDLFPEQTFDAQELETKYREFFLNPCAEILLVFNRHESRINYIISKRLPSVRPELQQLADMAEACRRLISEKDKTMRELRQMYEGSSS